MSNENRELIVNLKNELKTNVAKEMKQLTQGAIEIARKPLHDLGNSLLDYILDWVITKVSGSAR